MHRPPGRLDGASASKVEPLTQAFNDLSGRFFKEGDLGAERKALLYSVLLHLAVMVMAVVGLPVWIDPNSEVSPPVFEVQLAKLADRTVQKPKPEPAPPAPEPPKPVEQKAPPPPPPKPVEQQPEPPRPEVVEPAPSPKPKPKAEPEKPKFDPQQIAALLDKRLRDKPAPTPLEPQKVTAAPVAAAASPEILEAPLSISEIDLIRSQFERCWNPPVGARDAADLVIRVRIALNPDGSLAAAPELIDQSRMSDTFWRAAAESALRAVHKCQPLQDLPSSKYQRWRLIDLTFNPKEMLG